MTTATAHHAASSEGLKELANFVSLASQSLHGSVLGTFLHRWENVIFSWLIALLLILLAYFGTRKVSMVPSPFQNVLEILVDGYAGLMQNVLGEKSRKYLPFIGTLFIYIWVQNLFGLIPGMKSPTSNLNTTVALAVTVFFYIQWIGISENGLLGYIDHLMGSPRDLTGWMLVPLNFPLHILQEFIKPVSLSLRLFGNILGEDALIGAFITLSLSLSQLTHIPVGLPLQAPFLMLAILTGSIQAFVFSLLTAVYISLTLPSHEH